MNYLSTPSEELKSILSKYKQEWETACKCSRDDYMKTLGAGATVPKEGKIYGDAYKERFSEKCRELNAQANEILNNELAKVRDKKGEAPSTDAANTLMLASIRSKASEDDIAALIHSYGDNYQCYRTIQDIAAKNGRYLADHPLGQKESALIDLQRNIDNTLNIYNAENGQATGGYIAIMEALVDNTLSES